MTPTCSPPPLQFTNVSKADFFQAQTLYNNRKRTFGLLDDTHGGSNLVKRRFGGQEVPKLELSGQRSEIAVLKQLGIRSRAPITMDGR